MKQPTALITGASRRVGRQIALYLGARGFDIAIHCRKADKDSASLEKALKNLGVRSTVIEAELSDPVQVEKIVPQAKKALGTLSCLINNAARFEKDGLVDFTPEGLSAHLNTNLQAPLLLARAFKAQCSKSLNNCIINITDACVGMSISPNYLTYTLSRHALDHFTLLTAREFAPHVRINAVSAGLTLPGKQDKPGSFERLSKHVPLQRTSSPEEVCTAIGFLLDSPSVTGQIIALDGGLTA